MKKLFFILTNLALFLVIMFPDDARASACDSLKTNPEVHFSTSYGRLVYDYSYNREEITNISSGTEFQESGAFLSGLATVSIEKEAEVGTITETIGDNIICVLPRKVNVYVGLSNPKIYISRDLRKGSCTYNVVMRHEQTHQRINKAALDYFIPIFKVAAEKMAQNLKPIQISSYAEMDSASRRLSEQMYNEFEKIVNIFKKKLAVEQSKLDSGSNYAAEENICRDYNKKR